MKEHFIRPVKIKHEKMTLNIIHPIRQRGIMRIFAAALLISLTASCGKGFLDIGPINQKTEEDFYKTPQDAMEALVAAYSVLNMDGYGNIALTSEIASDNCFGGGGNGDGGMRQWDRFDNYNDHNAAAWKKYYTGIYRANIFLQKVDNVDFGNDEDTKKRLIAEAHFLRAYYYFDLVRMFGNVPLITAPLEPGNYNIPQADPAEVYKLIAEDLKIAAADLSDRKYADIPPAEQGRATRWAAKALLGRVFLYYTGYYNKPDIEGVFTRQDAIAAIDDVIMNSGHGLVEKYFNLWRASAETGGFAGQNNTEAVFAIQYTHLGLKNWDQQNGNRMQVMIGIRSQVLLPYYKGWGAATVNPKLWDAFAAGDTRRSASIISIQDEGLAGSYVVGDQYQYTGYFMKKNTPLDENKPEDLGGDFQLDNYDNYVVIRFADVLLMGAELNLNTDLGKAQDYYNRVRDRAFGDQLHRITLTGDAAGLKHIMDERRFELSMEGHRYWDLLRQGMATTKAALDNVSANSVFNVTFRPETGGLLAIPQTQIGLSNGSLIQNNGWN